MAADQAAGGASFTRRCVVQMTGLALALPVAPFQPIYLENRRMPFTPKFVDLVRNYTTTTGTADFVLSASVNGYLSFASALQAGDQFYYSAISIDKPLEREVGRGTLQANGTIARDPVSGIKTSFTAGTKTLSLIAAAEWFTAMQTGANSGSGGAGGVGVGTAGSRSSLAAMTQQGPAILNEAGREGLFVFDGSNFSAKVAADPYQAIYVAPSSDTSGASGAWTRKFSGHLQASWSGFANGASNNAARLESLMALVDPARGNVIELPFGTITMDRRVVIQQPCLITGFGGARGQSGGSGNTHLVFPAGSTGFRVQNNGGQQSRIENVKIAQAGMLSTTGAASYNAAAPTTISLSSPGDFQNGQVIWLEGAGPSLVVPGRTAATSAGSKTVTLNSTDDYGNAIGYVGQMVEIAGAGLPANTTIAAWGPGSITLSNNATATVSGAAITIRAPLVAEIQSGGGTTTLTIDSYPDAPQNVTGATIRHAAPAIYSTTQCHARSVEAGGDCQLGVVLAGITAGGAVADLCTFHECLFACDLAGVVLQGNDAQVNSFFACDFAGPKVGVLDDSFLGNYFYGCHWAFNCGLQVYRASANTQLIGGYFESHTGYAAANGIFIGTMSVVNGAGLKGFTNMGSHLQGPMLKLKGGIEAEDNGAGDGAMQIYGDALFHGTGSVTIQNTGDVYGGSGAATGRLRIWLNGGNQCYVSSGSDLWLNCESGSIQQRVGDFTITTASSTGLNLATGKTLSVAGQQVVGARGASLPADATDLASAVALVNAIKARLKATGGHGLVAD